MQNPKKAFPLFQANNQLVYFDNAATTPKPEAVLESMDQYYRKAGATVHRGVYRLSEQATEKFEAVRDQVKRFLNAKFREEIIFTSGATEGINLVAHSFAETFLVRGDEILLTEAEHHSNIVPWQIAAKKSGAIVRFAPLLDDGSLDMAAFEKLLNKKTRLVAVTAASNVTGAIFPLKKIIESAHKYKALVLVDAAQAAGHIPLDTQKLDCDFLAFSGHKIFGPTGVGVLYGKKALLSQMPPYQTGGSMIERVTKTGTTFASLPEKFEAGTPPIAEVIGLGEAIKFIGQTGWKRIQKQERLLSIYGLKKLSEVPDLKIIGSHNPQNRLPIFSFVLKGIHPHDIATLLDHKNIAVRAGHHCAQILHQSFRIPASTRASLAFYNTEKEIDRLFAALKGIHKIFS